ncbi:hypothetical protein J416_10721 [Gracilibacillus halophilus YIM-C55.5]|uniref:DUF4349 domain-containing protein n=1 Tax=Gracilibacillus halophilus YIM-C55.5 TaxID=1308866 RepID=N4WPU7_9BACI|nr:DUF4349 domain-containing protein [Gracilibacillus halophilus]ENH96480.1 hypothetical protein J416_10721 [Gracilibacillus halophilus YIM-C55.5]
MMRKWLLFFVVSCFIGITACSNADSNKADESTSEDRAAAENEQSGFQESNSSNSNSQALNNNQMEEEAASDTESSNTEEMNVSDRKIVYNASLQLETESYSDTVSFIEEQTNQSNGYIVSSNSTSHEEDQKRGSMTVRVPSNKFQPFLQVIEDGDIRVVNQSTSGEDVTEEYVDLESRLEAKKVVEERLLAFMEEADDTENLLNISSDLADVQEEIEQLTGKLNYLDNQASYATVTFSITEKNIEVTNVQDESLSTWERTKEQFTKSINALLSGASGIFIFFVGNAPIFLLIIFVGGLAYWIIRRRLKK